MKKLMVVLLALVFAFAMAACNSSKPESANSTGSDGGSGGGGEKFVLKLAGQAPDDHPSTQALYKFAEQIKEKTNGQVEIKVYPANQLGDYTTVYKEVLQGTIEMALITTPSEIDKRLDLLMMPYMVTGYTDNLEEKYKKGSYIFDTMNRINQEHGARLLAIHANGFGGLGTTKEIQNLTNIGADKGILIRTPPMPVFNEPMKDLGFRTVTIPYADLYTALQTGAADGWSGGEASLNYHGFRDVIKYFYTTNDFFNADALYINNALWERLGAENQRIIEEAAEELQLNSFATAEQYDNEYLKKLEEAGIKVVRLTEEEIRTLAEHVRKTTWPKLKADMTDEIIDGMIEAMGN